MSAGRGGADDSVLGRLEPHGWDPDDITSYEVAMDLLNEVVGIYTARLAELRRAESPDQQTVASLDLARAHCIAVQRQLRPGDHEEVARIRQECATIIREFHEPQRGPH